MCKGVPSNDNGLHDFLQVLHAGGGGGGEGEAKSTPLTLTQKYITAHVLVFYI